jgi:hypothetical protein
VGLAAHDGIRDLCVCVGGRDAGAAVIRGRAKREGVVRPCGWEGRGCRGNKGVREGVVRPCGCLG